MTVNATVDGYVFEVIKLGGETTIHQVVAPDYPRDPEGKDEDEDETITIYEDGLTDDVNNGDYFITICGRICFMVDELSDQQKATCKVPPLINEYTIQETTFEDYRIARMTVQPNGVEVVDAENFNLDSISRVYGTFYQSSVYSQLILQSAKLANYQVGRVELKLELTGNSDEIGSIPVTYTIEVL